MVGGHRRSVGVFTHRRDAEQALHELRDSGFDMNRVSVVVRDADRNADMAGAHVGEHVGNKADEGATVGLLSGGALGGLTGLLVGLGALAIPGIGPVMLAGATATTLATTLAGAGIGAVTGSLLGGLIGLGIPEERARVYNERVERGHYLVIVDGSDEEIAAAEAILHHRGIEEYGIYDRAHSNATVATPATPVRQRTRRAIGVFSHRHDAEAAVGELRTEGFSMDRVSLIAKDERVGAGHGGNKADEGLKSGAITGGVLGTLGGLLVGLGALAIPGVGPVILAGATATTLATALTGGAIGAAAGGIVGGLVGLGIPEEQARVYSDRFNRGHYLLMVEGTDAELDRAEAILRRRGIEDFIIYEAADSDRELSSSHNQAVGYEKFDTTPSSYSAVDSDAPVVIIDRRSEIV